MAIKTIKLAITLLIIFTCAGCTANNGEIKTTELKSTNVPNIKEVQLKVTDSEDLSKQQLPVATSAFLSKDTTLGDDIPVSRALVAKMIALTYNDKNFIKTMEREINFTDTSDDKWFDKYINTVRVQNYMVGEGNTFLPNESVTLEQAQIIIDKLNPNNKLKMKITEETKNKPISYALWVDLYKKMLDDLSASSSLEDTFFITEKNFIVLALPNEKNKLGIWNLITDKGPVTFEGLSMEKYLDKEIKVLIKDNEIIAVLNVENENPTIENSYIVKSDSNTITVFSGGAERTYKYNNTLGDISNKICDIQISNDTALDVKIYDEIITSEIKKVGTDFIELKDKGNIKVNNNIKVYSIVDGSVKWKKISDLIVGTDIAKFVMKNQEICSAVIMKTVKLENIRVAISTTEFKSLYHKNVIVSSTENFTVKYGTETKEYKAGTILTFSDTENEKLFLDDRIYIQATNDTGKIRINSVKRNWPDSQAPEYRGIIEIGKGEKGFTIVNELRMEEYLYAVVPSEMPSTYGLEASKVQAVTARSYAYNQFYENRFHQYGANVDDSVICQVYNNIPENKNSIQAVDDTKGQCIVFNNNVVSTNFFSTSSGMTANSGEVWSNYITKEFPTKTSTYLKATKQYTGNDYGDLRVEENASKFFTDWKVNSYDSSFGWFRWNVEMTAKEVKASLDKNLKERYSQAPNFIKTLQPDGVYRSRPISTVGEIKNIEVLERGEGGNIIKLKIIGSEAIVIIYTEYNIRMLIRPMSYLKDGKEIVINRIDGTKVNNYSLMPSAFFVMEKTMENSKLSKIKFVGGGNGHGVGMSQNGVKGMIDAGFTFEQIIKHYYTGTEIKVKM